MRKNKSLIMAMAIILAVATIASATTFAWFTASDTVVNKLKNEQYGEDSVVIYEVFDPDTPLEPGVKVRKEVGAMNTGGSAAVVRISFAELLEKIDDAANYPAIKNGKWTDAGLSATPKNVPALFNGSAYESNPDWITLTGSNYSTYFTGTAPAFPADIIIKMKETIITESTGLVRKYYNFVYYTTALTSTDDLYDGKYQKVAPVDWEFNNSAKTLQWTGWEYYTFNMTGGSVKWADFLKPTAEPESAYTKDTPAVGDFTVGTTPPLKTFSRLDKTNQYIQLFFSTYVKTDLSTCVLGDWWYNAADGYFYYIGTLAPAATTNMLLTNIFMDPAASNIAGNDYSGLKYDLVVKMNAIQAVDLALSSTSGWDLGDLATPTSTAALLVAKFAAVGTPLAEGTP